MRRAQLHLAVNQLAHHALATQLAPCLAAGAAASGVPSRVVVVASAAARWPGAEAALHDALAGGAPEGGAPWASYAGSKLANVAWCRAAAARWQPARVQVLAVHPGTAPSGLQRHKGPLGAALNAASAAIGATPDRRAPAARSHACMRADAPAADAAPLARRHRAAARVVEVATACEGEVCKGALRASDVSDALAQQVWDAGEAALARVEAADVALDRQKAALLPL